MGRRGGGPVFRGQVGGGINRYVGWMRDRVMQMYRVLKPTGTFYLHCDWHAGHYLKVMLDGVFGYSNFRNEIAWCYAGGGVPKKDLPRKHDTIFRYTKTKDYFFAPMYRPYSEGAVQRGRTHGRQGQVRRAGVAQRGHSHKRLVGGRAQDHQPDRPGEVGLPHAKVRSPP